VNEGAILAQQSERVVLSDGQEYELQYNMRALVELERKYGTMPIYSLALAGGDPQHGMLMAVVDGLSAGLRWTKRADLSDPERLMDLFKPGAVQSYIRATTRAINICLTGEPETGDQDEGWSDLPDDVREDLTALFRDTGDVRASLLAYVQRHNQQADQSKEDGGEEGNFLGAPGTGS
jgi:hypothetical protein